MSSSSSSACPIPLFNSDCIPASPCRVSFDFIDDCVLPELPDPIYDCDPPIPPVFEPPPDEFCPNIRGDENGANVTVTYLNNNCGSSSSSAVPRGTVVVTETVDCDFIIGLDLDIPIPLPPCPIFTNKNPPKVDVVFDDELCTAGKTNSITITPVPAENCDGPCTFDIDLNLLIPIPKIRCPIFSDDNPVKVESKFESCVTNTSKLTVTSKPVPGDCNNADTCEFTIDLDLVVPIPEPPCPVINETQKVNVTSYYTTPGCATNQSTFRVTTTTVPGSCFTNTPDTCRFDFDLDLSVPIIEPPCPKFNDGTVTIKTYDAQNPFIPPSTLKFEQKPANPNCNEPTQCEFDIELELNIPIPNIECPKIRTNVVNTKLINGPQFKIDSMVFSPPVKDDFNDECVFEVEFNVVIPPIPPFLIIAPTEVTETVCDADYELTFKQEQVFNPATNRWELTLTPSLIVPVAPKLYPGTVTVAGGLGSGQITLADNGNGCDKTINLTITLNTAQCATGGGGDPSSSPPSLACGPDNCAGSCPPGQDCSMAGGGPGCGCVTFATATAIKNGIDVCNDPTYPCPENSADFCPPGSRCNPYTA